MDDLNIDYTKLNTARNKAIDLRKALSLKRISAQKGRYSITIDGNQTVLESLVDGDEDQDLKEVLVEVVSKSQEVAASELANL